MTHPIDRKIITTEAVRGILRDAGAPPIVYIDDGHPDPYGALREDLESIRSLYFTGLELRAPQCRQEVARILAAATDLRSLISLEIGGEKPTPPFFHALNIRHHGFLRHLNSFIADLEGDTSPALVRQLDVFRGVSAFENVIRMLADRWRHYFDMEPTYTITVDTFVGDKAQIGGEVRSGGFVDFAERALAVMGICKSDGTPYSRRAISAALTKVKR
jgi:hypothetical protein